MTDVIDRRRISENPGNFQAVFDMAMGTAAQVRDGQLEPNEATAISRNVAIGQRILESDLKGRMIDHRMRAKTVVGNRLSGPVDA